MYPEVTTLTVVNPAVTTLTAVFRYRMLVFEQPVLQPTTENCDRILGEAGIKDARVGEEKVGEGQFRPGTTCAVFAIRCDFAPVVNWLFMINIQTSVLAISLSPCTLFMEHTSENPSSLSTFSRFICYTSRLTVSTVCSS